MMSAAIRRDEIVGKCIRSVLQTGWSERADAASGYAEPHHCEIVVELDSGQRLRFNDSNLEPAAQADGMGEARVFGEPDLQYLGERIAQVVIDQYDEVYIVLDNGVYVQNLVLEDAGNCFWLGSIRELQEDEDEEEQIEFFDFWSREPVQLW